VTVPYAQFVGLSCYTANLGAYLEEEWPGSDTRLAASVRLAVRTDLPGAELAFSHHDEPLDRLPDGTALRYGAASPGDTLAEATAELEQYGRVLLVVDNARLPWSPSYGSAGAAAPHWLLVRGRRRSRWDVLDLFAGLLPTGEQLPYEGRLDTVQLRAALVPSGPWTAAQQRRNTLAFGFPVAVPAGASWLYRAPAAGGSAALRGGWVDGPHALPFLAEHLVRHGAGAAYLDDLWTAAGHHAFRYGRLARVATGAERDTLTAAAEAWQRLPSAARFAIDSARRGRARPQLLHRTLDELDRLERAARRTAEPSAPARDLPTLRSLR
jgi:hypothetical protein